VSDDLAGLLAAGERAAFHGRPAAGIGPLRTAVDQAVETGRPDEASAATWLLGVSLGACGRYGQALAVLDPLADGDHAGVAARRLFASLAASTGASVHRQLGRHEAARLLDRRALEIEPEAAEAVFDARLGLAADAVGLADLDTARAEAEVAAALVDSRPDWWRQRVRLGWVRAEVALLAGDPAEAERTGDGAVALAESSGAPRHVAKGLLFVGVAQIEQGRSAEAAATLRRSATLADSLGCVPLVWPSRAVLGALLQEAHPEESARNLAAARTAVLAIAQDLPEDLREGWLRRLDIVALLEG